MGGAARNPFPQEDLYGILPIPVLLGAVGMGNTNRDPGPFGGEEGNGAHAVQMAMDDFVFSMGSEETEQCPVVAGIQGIQPGKPVDPAAQGFDFIVKIGPEGTVHQKIELDLLSVNVTVAVHEKGFQTAPVHI